MINLDGGRQMSDMENINQSKNNRKLWNWFLGDAAGASQKWTKREILDIRDS